MLRQSSLGGNAHWAFPFAAELRVEARPLSPACSTEIGRRGDGGCSDRASSASAPCSAMV